MKTVYYSLIYLVSLAQVYGQEPTMTVHIIDVGQGSATLIEFPCGAVLIDTGGESNSEFESTSGLSGYLDEFFHRRNDLSNTIDLLIISHPHIDHTRGINEITSKYIVKNVITNGQSTGSGRHGQIALHNLIATNEGTSDPSDDIGYFESLMTRIPPGGLTNSIIDPINCVGADPTITILGGQMLSDPGWGKENGEPNFDDENNHSVVCKIEFGESSIIMTGDLEEPAISSLLSHHANQNAFDSDVYLVGHHGSKNGTTISFLQAITPEIAILSFGDHTRQLSFTAWDYGHPNKDIVQMLVNSVSGTRPPTNVLVGNGKRRFITKTISKELYGVGWDGTILLSGGLDGHWTRGAATDNRISINEASLAQLLTLPSIGATRAQAIIDRRTSQRFNSIEELDDVPGIGPATITLLRPLVRM